MKHYFLSAIRILIGLTFLLSGFLKLYPIEPFELNFIDLGIGTWHTAPFIARLLIALELLLGVLLVFNVLLKKRVLHATLWLLLFFTIYLVIQLIKEGNSGNCGCFGTYLEMTPLQSILKNILLMTLAVILIKFQDTRFFRFSKLVLFISLPVCLVLPFVLNPVDLMASTYRQPESTRFPFDFSLLATGSPLPPADIDLENGKHIIAFLSMTCEHCKSIAFKMHVMKKRHPEIPFLMVLNGKESSLHDFLAETKAENIPYTVLRGMPFAKITGGSVPKIYWIDNGIVVRKSLYISLEEAEILEWLNNNQQL